MLIRLMVVIISLCICIPNHHVVHLKCVQFLYIKYISIKIKSERKTVEMEKTGIILSHKKEHIWTSPETL